MTVVEVFDLPGKKYFIPYPCDNEYECFPIELRIKKGTYLFELWGSGKYSSGGYVRGEIHLYEETTTFLLFIGSIAPEDQEHCGFGGYNGGGTSNVIGLSGTDIQSCRSVGGNGATDIRLNETLESRILVAGGSGGGCDPLPGGYGGGFIAGDGSYSSKESQGTKVKGYGGNQTNGGSGWLNGTFGYGANISCTGSTDLNGGGGGGWYGGGSGYHSDLTSSGGGGSSFINGNPECIITSEKYKFYNSFTLSGNETMPLPTKYKSEGSYYGNGFAIITCIDPFITCKQNPIKNILNSFSIKFSMIFIIFSI